MILVFLLWVQTINYQLNIRGLNLAGFIRVLNRLNCFVQHDYSARSLSFFQFYIFIYLSLSLSHFCYIRRDEMKEASFSEMTMIEEPGSI